MKKNPAKLAVKTAGKSLTYHEFDILSRAIAAGIEALNGPRPSGNIGVLLGDPPDMLAGIFGVLRTGHTYVPLVSEYPAKRLSLMIRQAQMPLLLTDAAHHQRVLEAIGDLENVRVLLIEDIDPMETPPDQDNRPVYSDTNASLLYTSGSTGTPKGVPQTHRNILYYIRQYIRNLGLTAEDNLTLFASFSHDMTIMDMYSGLLSGATLFPLDLKEDGVFTTLPQWLRDEGITVWHSVVTVFRYFTAGLNPPTELPHLPHLRYIVLGGEPVIANDILKFNTSFTQCPNCKLYVLYGQTESSYNSGRFYLPGDSPDNMNLGDVNEGIELYVVDKKGDEVDPYEVGEIVVAGRHISPGYWKDPDTSREKFMDDPDSGRLYFTGDFGRSLADGKIEFFGRQDNQVKLRGFRIELGEIENTLMQYPNMLETAVVPVGTSHQEKFIACYFSARQDIGLDMLRTYLEERLPDHMIPSYFKQLKKLPVTVSGKINRSALPAPEVTPDNEYVPPRTDMEKQLVEIWSDILQLGKEVIGIESNFFQLGGHSLRATALTARIYKDLEIKVPLSQVFENRTVKELARTMEQCQTTRPDRVEPVEKKEYYPISAVQQRFYDAQDMFPQDTTYNMAYYFPFKGPTDLEGLREMFRLLVQRHEVFRTSFEILDGQVVQRVHEPGDMEISVVYLETQPSEAADEFNRFIVPFDLSRAPLARFGILDSGDVKRMIMDFHHIITDNISLNMLEDDCWAFAEDRPLPPLEVQYKDYAQWENSPGHREVIREKEKYWLNIFDRQLPRLDFPYDFPRPEIMTRDGSVFNTLLGQAETRKVKSFAQKTGTTFFILGLTAFNLLLSRLSRQDDIIVGTPIDVRVLPELQRMQGMLTNFLPQRNYPANEKTITQFINEVKQNTLDAFENREYPYELLAKKLKGQNIPNRTPIFDMIFNVVDERLYMGDTAIFGEQEVFLARRKTVQTDLTLVAVDRGDNILMKYQYSTLLFKKETVETLSTYYNNILSVIIEQPHLKLADIDEPAGLGNGSLKG
ncbi:MAG: AMP-binding protein [bacterium]|nr:AMP-binding protein [bacterium]